MSPRTRYFMLKGIRWGILCLGLAAIIIAGKSGMTASHQIAGADQRPLEPVSQPADRVNINTATLQQLMDLPTIGQVIGGRIIEYRQQHGPFARRSDIIIIKGISEHKFRQLEDLITVE